MAEKENEPISGQKKKRKLLSLRKRSKSSAELPSKCFQEIPRDNLESFKQKVLCRNTEKSQTWALSVFCNWLQYHNECDEAEHYTEEDLVSEDSKKVCNMMCKFVVECRQKNGIPYSPKTIVQLSSNLQSLALLRNPTVCQYMESKDVRFKVVSAEFYFHKPMTGHLELYLFYCFIHFLLYIGQY